MAKPIKKNSFLKTLSGLGVEVRSARDALQIKGYLDSGNYALNWAISGRMLGGYPLGHCGEIFGDPATGKSFLAARAIAMAQKQGGEALLDDTEGAYVAERMENIGVDVDALAVVAPRSRTVNDHLKITQAFVGAVKDNNPPVAIEVLDSLAQLSTVHEMKVGLDKRDMTKAAELKAFYRIVGGDLFDLPVVHIATNHTIAAIGSMFQTRTTGGGGGPKFMASWRIDMRAVSKIKVGKGPGADVKGVICRAVLDKNRFQAPFREVRIAIPFDRPISRATGLIPLLVSLGVLRIDGNYLLHANGAKLGRNYKAKERFLDQDEVGEQLLDAYPEILDETDAQLEAGTLQYSSAVTEEADVDADEEEKA